MGDETYFSGSQDVSSKILAVVLAIAIWAVAITDKQTASTDSKIEVSGGARDSKEYSR